MAKLPTGLEEALIEAVERERQRVGQQLHDTLCQSLTGMSIMVRLLGRRLKEGTPIESAQLDDLEKMIDHAADEARDLSRKLRPVHMEAGGLMSSLEELAHRTNRTTECEFRYRHVVLIEDEMVALTLYRIAEEAVAHAQRTAKAKKITIALSQKEGTTTLEIHSDGKGATSFEIASGQCRARSIGGTVSCRKGEKGTVVTCSVPRRESGKAEG